MVKLSRLLKLTLICLLLGSLAGSASGQQGNMQKEVVRFDFRGGVARTRRPFKNQARLIKNARLMADGTLEVRGGQALHKTVGVGSEGSIEAIYGYYDKTLGMKIYSVKREDGVNDKIYEDSVQLTGVVYGVGDHNSIAQYKGTIFFSNGAGTNPITYHVPGTGTIAFISGTPAPPIGKNLLFYRDRAYVGDQNGIVWWSNAYMFETLPVCDFPELNFHSIGDSKKPVTAMIAAQDFLIAFTRNSYHVMTGVPDDDGGIGDMKWQAFTRLGCLFPPSVTISGREVIFFASDRRIYSLTGTVLTDLDENNYIQEYLTSVHISVIKNVSLFHLGDELWMYLPKAGDSADGRMLVYNKALESWTVFENINGYAFTRVPFLNTFYVGSASGGYVWEQDHGDTDLGTNIAFELISRPEPLGILRHKKRYRLCSVQAQLAPGDSLDVSYSLDFSGEYTSLGSMSATEILWGAELWGVSNWGAYTPQTVFLHMFAVGRELQLKITGDVLGGTRFLGYHVEGEEIQRNY